MVHQKVDIFICILVCYAQNVFYLILVRAIHKVRHARVGGIREGVTVCDRGGGQEPVTSHL